MLSIFPQLIGHLFLWLNIYLNPLTTVWLVQFTLIHGPNIPGSYAILFSTATDFTFTTRHIHNWASFLLWPSCFILSVSISNCPSFFPSRTLDILRPEGLIFQCHIFCLFILFMGFSQEYRSCLPFPPPVDHVLSELFTMTHLSWVALHSTAHGFIELCKPLHHNKAMIHEGDPKRRHLGQWQPLLKIILVLL